MKKFRRSLSSEDRNSFCVARGENKNMLKRKKEDFNAVLLDKLISSVKSQKDFWETVHKISFKRYGTLFLSLLGMPRHSPLSSQN